jgi:protein tyrosine phosphatase type 4A
VLVAIAFIENGMSPLDAVEFIRRKRRGAFNSKQIQFLDGYKKSKKTPFMTSLSRLFNKKRTISNSSTSSGEVEEPSKAEASLPIAC